ncbi:hypothetical protein [Streptomyces sp. NPDC127084]|uniref:hypothetical protein n=1 Tax=Streptomyces sp. NPDC127084 TaxID=3347133 RepID=UPI0036544AA0
MAIVLAIVGGFASLSGCTQEGSSPKPIVQRATGAPTAVATADAEEAAVIAAYTHSWEAQTEAYSKASSAGTDLRKSTTFKALAGIERDLSAMQKAGQVTTGQPAIDPKVVTVTDAKIPKATVSDCVDTTRWALIDKASKKKVPLPTERLIKYVSTATLEKWGTTWMVTELTAQNQAC